MAILQFYDGKTIEQTAAITRRSASSVKRYLRNWNKDGYNGLVPQFDGDQNQEYLTSTGRRF